MDGGTKEQGDGGSRRGLEDTRGGGEGRIWLGKRRGSVGEEQGQSLILIPLHLRSGIGIHEDDIQRLFHLHLELDVEGVLGGGGKETVGRRFWWCGWGICGGGSGWHFWRVEGGGWRVMGNG